MNFEHALKNIVVPKKQTADEDGILKKEEPK
jgi:hypothetical protein